MREDLVMIKYSYLLIYHILFKSYLPHLKSLVNNTIPFKYSLFIREYVGPKVKNMRIFELKTNQSQGTHITLLRDRAMLILKSGESIESELNKLSPLSVNSEDTIFKIKYPFFCLFFFWVNLKGRERFKS